MNNTHVLSILLSKLSVLLISAAMAQATYTVTPNVTPVTIQNPIVNQLSTSKPETNLTISEIKEYVRSQAKIYGINVQKAEWIIGHESSYCWQEGYYNPAIKGKEPNGSTSVGCWQFNNRNPDFDLACASDLKCSTKTAMEWIVAGKINKWSTYSMCQEMYKNCPF